MIKKENYRKSKIAFSNTKYSRNINLVTKKLNTQTNKILEKLNVNSSEINNYMEYHKQYHAIEGRLLVRMTEDIEKIRADVVELKDFKF
jgi:hypothetical protein